MLSVDQFYKSHIGKAYDVDHSYGAQCVDGFKLFTLEQYGIANYNCTNGWASGLWIYRKQKPYYQHFIEVPLGNIQNGDWVFWNNGSRDCPDSHVAMYYNGKYFGQNQNGCRSFSLASISTNGVLGVLRPKIYINNEKEYINIPEWIEVRNIYNFNKVQIATIKPKKFGGLSYLIHGYRDNKTYAVIRTIDYGECLVKVTKSTPITKKPKYTHGNF